MTDLRGEQHQRLVAEQPAVVAVDEDIAALAEERANYARWVTARGDERVLAEQQHAERVQAAIEAGEPPPPAPPDPWPAKMHTARVAAFAGRAQMLADARVEAVAGVAERVVAEARARYAKAMKTAQPHLDALAEVCRTVASLQGAVHEVRTAENALARADPQRGGLQVEPPVKLTVAALAEAMAAGTDVLLEPRAASSRVVGLSGPGFSNGVPASAREPRPPPPDYQRQPLSWRTE